MRDREGGRRSDPLLNRARTEEQGMDADQKPSRLDEIKAQLETLYAQQAQAIADGDLRRAAELQAEIKEASRE